MFPYAGKGNRRHGNERRLGKNLGINCFDTAAPTVYCTCTVLYTSNHGRAVSNVCTVLLELCGAHQMPGAAKDHASHSDEVL